MDYDKFVDQMRLIMQSPASDADCRIFEEWANGKIGIRRCWRAFLRNNGKVWTDWRWVTNDIYFGWWLNSLGYWRGADSDDEQEDI